MLQGRSCRMCSPSARPSTAAPWSLARSAPSSLLSLRATSTTTTTTAPAAVTTLAQKSASEKVQISVSSYYQSTIKETKERQQQGVGIQRKSFAQPINTCHPILWLTWTVHSKEMIQAQCYQNFLPYFCTRKSLPTNHSTDKPRNGLVRTRYKND